MSTATLILFKPDGSTDSRVCAGKKATLKELQDAVGGYIELIRVRHEGKVRDAYVNENGRFDGLPHNAQATTMASEFGYGPLVGNAVIEVSP